MTNETKNKSAAFNEAYASLNAAQKEAVDSIEGPVSVVAGPGTGKTQILTLRIANILKQTDVTPENILALTFTNSGVRAMRERLRTYIKDDAYRVGIYTFHSFAEHVLQKYKEYFPSQEFSSVISDIEKAKLIENILTEHQFVEIVSNYDRFSSLRQVMDAINNIKQEGYHPAEFEALIPSWEAEQLQSEEMFYKRATGKYKAGDIKPTEKQKVEKRVAKAREIATVFKAYQQALAKEKRYDFSDMILTVLQELKNNENLKLDLQEQYQYILVDEHQDTNDGQNRLIEFLTDAEHLNLRPNLFTVGDEKQSIYRFQGASDKVFDYFKNHYADVSVIELEQNYRSTKSILSGSHELIVNSLPEAKSLKSNIEIESKVEVREFSDYKFELLFLAQDIKKKIEKGVSVDEIAVIYRSNKHLSDIKNIFQQYEVPYQVRSKDTMLDDPVIVMFITLLRVIVDPYDSHSLGKLLFADFLQLDSLAVAETLRSYRSARKKRESLSLIDILKSDNKYDFVVSLISDLQIFEANHSFPETFKEALHKSGFLTNLIKKPDSQNGLRKVEVLFNEIRQQDDRSAEYSAKDFIGFVDSTLKYNLNMDVIAAPVGKGVQCMTAHGAKGLEFECVYMVNATRSNWEKSRGFGAISLPLSRYVGDLDDERRLFYVALTRAKHNLFISSSKQDWSGRSLEPSQFISELADNSIDIKTVEEFEANNESELIRFFSNEKEKKSVFDTDYLAARFQEENLSVTALNNYIECPIKYLFRNLIQLPDTYTPALRYGDTVHKALEAFFARSVDAKEILPKEELLNAYNQAMDLAGFYGTDYDNFLVQGRRSLGMYYDYYGVDWSISVLLEEYIRRSYNAGTISLTLSGKIDKLEFLETVGKGNVRVIDYKTGKTYSEKSTKAQKQALERQIHFYHLLLENYKGGDVVVTEALLDFVEPSKKNEFEQKTFDVTQADIKELETAILNMSEDVVSGAFLKKGCGKKDCESCIFWNVVHR